VSERERVCVYVGVCVCGCMCTNPKSDSYFVAFVIHVRDVTHTYVIRHMFYGMSCSHV